MLALQALRVYFENPVGRLLEHADGYVVISYSSGPRELPHLQAFLTHAGTLLRNRGWNRIFADQRLMSPFTEEERAWIVDYWLSAGASDGATFYGAVLLPTDVFARLSVNLVMSEARQAALTYRVFDDEAEALRWLLQVG